MTGLPISFAAPWLLLALLALPILWLLLRAVPPAPVRRRFPGVILLLGLADDENVTDRTPWWLLLLRMLAVAAMIVGLAGPVLNPDAAHDRGDGPLLIVLDGSWASAASWPMRTGRIEQELAEAGRDGRPVAILRLTAPEPLRFLAADAWAARLPGLAPEAWAPAPDLSQNIDALLSEGRFETVWFSDGLERPGRGDLLQRLEARGPVRVSETGLPVWALEPPQVEGGKITLTARRTTAAAPRDMRVLAQGKDPAGTDRVLASVDIPFDASATSGTATLALPPELLARITRFSLQGVRSAGAVTLSDDRLKRSEIALISGRDDREGLELLSPLHFLRQALMPSADLLDGALLDLMPANPDVVVLADIATLSAAEEAALIAWIDKGGLLLRFAGPRLAASDVSRDAEHPLLPVRLRAGGRSVGGAMSWGEPKTLAPFPVESPFFGLPLPDDVKVSAQVVAQPDPDLANRVIAQLSDGTPLVTRKKIGRGQVVLFHVTANAEWSGLPLSGLFVQMLERLAVAGSSDAPNAAQLAGTTWQPVQVLDAAGRLQDGQSLAGVAGEAILTDALGAALPPGIYQSEGRALARNVFATGDALMAARWPARIPVTGFERARATDLSGWLIAGALLLLLADVVASLALSGRLFGARVAAVFLAGAFAATPQSEAQSAPPTDASLEVVLAHVLTSDKKVDDTARAGLVGLSETLFFRTSVEPSAPVGIDLERDELAFFPFLYWPITVDQPQPSDAAYGKLNAYLRAGGLILFDTRDGDVAGFGAASPTGRKLQKIAAPLDIPPLEPVPGDHVLTRTFYLLQDFPGRYAGRDVWVEAAPPDAERIEGMPFRNLNDGVTPVVIGGNDWAAAWAMDGRGNALYPVGRGYAGERQRELAFRFGVNLVMHVLTGNYKSDQVHVPALLERLGQ